MWRWKKHPSPIHTLSNWIYLHTWYEIHLCRRLSYLLCFCPPQIVTKSLPLILCILNLFLDFASILLTIQFYTDIILTNTSFDSRVSQTSRNIFPWNLVVEVTCSAEKGKKQQKWCVNAFCAWESDTVLWRSCGSVCFSIIYGFELLDAKRTNHVLKY